MERKENRHILKKRDFKNKMQFQKKLEIKTKIVCLLLYLQVNRDQKLLT